jgi:hypothetical protein
MALDEFVYSLLRNNKEKLRAAMALNNPTIFMVEEGEILFADGEPDGADPSGVIRGATIGMNYINSENDLSSKGYEMFTLAQMRQWERVTGKPFLSRYESWVKTDNRRRAFVFGPMIGGNASSMGEFALDDRSSMRIARRVLRV